MCCHNFFAKEKMLAFDSILGDIAHIAPHHCVSTRDVGDINNLAGFRNRGHVIGL